MHVKPLVKYGSVSCFTRSVIKKPGLKVYLFDTIV